MSNKIIAITIALALAACGTPADDSTAAEAQALVSTQHALSDWYNPPEWSYHGAPGVTACAQDSPGALDSAYVTMPHGVGFQCGSAKFLGLFGQCARIHPTRVTIDFAVTALPSRTPQGIWAYIQPAESQTDYRVSNFVPVPAGITSSAIWSSTTNPITGKPWTALDLGCGAPQRPVFGYCNAVNVDAGDVRVETFTVSFETQ